MRLGLSLGVTAPTPSNGPWTPAALFGAADRGAWYDVDTASAFQDSSGTTPADTVNDPVLYLTDKSGKGNHATETDAARALTLVNLTTSFAVRTTASDYVLVDLTPRAFGVFTICVAVRGASGGAAGQGTFGLVDRNGKSTTTTFCGLRSSGNTWQMWDGVSVRNSGVSSDLNARVITIVGNASNTNAYTLRIDGAVNTNGTIASGTPVTVPNCALCVTPPILNADETDFYGGIFIDRILTAGEIALMEAQLAAKAGVTLA